MDPGTDEEGLSYAGRDLVRTENADSGRAGIPWSVCGGGGSAHHRSGRDSNQNKQKDKQKDAERAEGRR